MIELDWTAKIQTIKWKPLIFGCGLGFITANILSVWITHNILKNSSTNTLDKASKVQPPNETQFVEKTVSNKDIKDIIERNMFNSTGKVPDDDTERGSKDRTKIIPTDLPLKLVGTIFGGSSLTSIAMIENTTKNIINSFLVGDSVMEGAVVKEIFQEKVIFERDGGLEYLEVKKDEIKPKRGEKKPVKYDVTRGAAPLATTPPPVEFREEGFERAGTKAKMTSTYKNKLLTEEFAKVLQDAKADPYMADGEVKGWTLSKIREDSIYRKLGLQDQDIIEELNGTPLGDPGQAIKLLNSFRNESKIELTIKRNGVSQTLNIDVQ